MKSNIDDYKYIINRLLILINPITASYRHNKDFSSVSSRHINNLVDYQIDVENYLETMDKRDQIVEPEDIIPKGLYCYERKENNRIQLCYYYTHIIDHGITIPFCKLLGEGDISSIGEEKIKILLEKYHTDEELWEAYPLNILFDQCKECGVNYGLEDNES